MLSLNDQIPALNTRPKSDIQQIPGKASVSPDRAARPGSASQRDVNSSTFILHGEDGALRADVVRSHHVQESRPPYSQTN